MRPGHLTHIASMYEDLRSQKHPLPDLAFKFEQEHHTFFSFGFYKGKLAKNEHENQAA